MSLDHGDDFQEFPSTLDNDQPEVEPEAGPRAERPNFLTATRFVDFDLPPEILEGLDKAGFEYCTPIQAQAIPVAMKGLDLAGQAQTGTGKTTAFLVPLLNRLLTGKPLEPDVPRAIIVTPTRELALQIHEDALVLASATNLRQALVIGGMDYKEQAELLATAPEIVICTPGRIIDYLQQGVFKTKGIEVAVVDEADRLLDMGFIKDLKYLLGKLPPFTQRQTMLFSATLDERVLELTYEFMNPPQYITAEPDKSTKIEIAQELYHVGRDEKLSLLLGLLRREEHRRVIIFANTKSGVEWLSKKLMMNGFQAEGITGDLPQPKRLKLMEAFKENRLQILVATDVASRGIHVDDVSHVYNYDLPQDAENYVHRIGRTARAGHAGKAVSFGCEDYVFHLEAIENLLGEKIPVFWAEQDWFQEDHGGEVRLKDRRINDRKKSGGREGRAESGSGRSPARAPARSQRPGGIFGLSPRFPGQAENDPHRTLSWTVEDSEAVAPSEILEASPIETSDAKEKDVKPERDRRRKRRRGRRGREEAEITTEAILATPPETLTGTDQSAMPDLPSAEIEKESAPVAVAEASVHDTPEPAEEKPPIAEQAEQESGAPQKTAAKKPRRATAGRRTKKGLAESEITIAEPAPAVTNVPAADATPIDADETAKPARKPARTRAKTGASESDTVKKPSRSTKKSAESKTIASELEVETVAEPPVKKPGRSTKKVTETPKTTNGTTAVAAPKTTRAGQAARKKREETAARPATTAPTAEDPLNKRTQAARKTAENPTSAKKKTTGKVNDSTNAPVKKSRAAKKSTSATD